MGALQGLIDAGVLSIGGLAWQPTVAGWGPKEQETRAITGTKLSIADGRPVGTG